MATCSARDCGRLVSAALPLHSHSAPTFDRKVYCSRRCAELVSQEERRLPAGPLVTCSVCCEDKPLTDYVFKITEHPYDQGHWNIQIPPGCLPHIAPELQGLEGGTCVQCIGAHIRTQLEARGAINMNCIQNCLEAPANNILSRNWVPHARQFLPIDKRDAFDEQLVDECLRTDGLSHWICPSNCGYRGGVLQPNNTPGFPHVECLGCEDHFCANCKVAWHTGQTCQQFSDAHPELRDEEEQQQLRDMARRLARRCPRCQIIIIKDGGCHHMLCEHCNFEFDWEKAERVTTPLPTAGSSIQSSHAPNSWSQTHGGYTSHTEATNIGLFGYGGDNPQQHEKLFLYDKYTFQWSPELCELDAIASRDAGYRFIRTPSRDRGYLWAFTEVDGDYVGGVDLAGALDGVYIHAPYGGEEHVRGIDPSGRLVVPRDPRTEVYPVVRNLIRQMNEVLNDRDARLRATGGQLVNRFAARELTAAGEWQDFDADGWEVMPDPWHPRGRPEMRPYHVADHLGGGQGDAGSAWNGPYHSNIANNLGGAQEAVDFAWDGAHNNVGDNDNEQDTVVNTASRTPLDHRPLPVEQRTSGGTVPPWETSRDAIDIAFGHMLFGNGAPGGSGDQAAVFGVGAALPSTITFGGVDELDSDHEHGST